MSANDQMMSGGDLLNLLKVFAVPIDLSGDMWCAQVSVRSCLLHIVCKPKSFDP